MNQQLYIWVLPNVRKTDDETETIFLNATSDSRDGAARAIENYLLALRVFSDDDFQNLKKWLAQNEPIVPEMSQSGVWFLRVGATVSFNNTDTVRAIHAGAL